MKRTHFFLVLAAGLLIVSGCGSDALVPKDDLPPVTAQDSAGQAGLVAYAVSTVGPLAVTFGTKSENYTFPQGSSVQGSVNLDYRLGGAQGTPATYGTADYVEITTVGNDGLTVTSPLGGQIHFTADIMATISQAVPKSATVLTGSHGTMNAGDYSSTFTIEGLTVYQLGYPSGGPITFDNGFHVLEIDFDGTHTVHISEDGVDLWTFDLITLILSDA